MLGETGLIYAYIDTIWSVSNAHSASGVLNPTQKSNLKKDASELEKDLFKCEKFSLL